MSHLLTYLTRKTCLSFMRLEKIYKSGKKFVKVDLKVKGLMRMGYMSCTSQVILPSWSTCRVEGGRCQVEGVPRCAGDQVVPVTWMKVLISSPPKLLPAKL